MAKLEVADAIAPGPVLSPCRPRLRRPRWLPGEHRRRLHRVGDRRRGRHRRARPGSPPHRRPGGGAHLQSYPTPARRRLRRAPLREPLGPGHTDRCRHARRRAPGERLGRSRHSVLRVRRARCARRAGLSRRVGGPSPTERALDGLPRHPTAVPHRHAHPRRPRWRRGSTRQRFSHPVVRPRTGRGDRRPPRAQYGQRPLRRRQRCRCRQRDPDAVQRRFSRAPVRARDTPGHGDRLRRRSTPWRSASACSSPPSAAGVCSASVPWASC